MTNKKTDTQPTPAGRVKRVRVGAQNALEVMNKDPNFHYRIVNDRDGNGQRLQMFLRADWTFVDERDGVTTDTGRVDQPADLGTNKTFAVGRGTKAYLMKIPKELYEQDQAEKQREDVDAQEESIYSGSEGDYGNVKGGRGTARDIDNIR